MIRVRWTAGAAALVVAAAVITACSGDDGSSTAPVPPVSASAADEVVVAVEIDEAIPDGFLPPEEQLATGSLIPGLDAEQQRADLEAVVAWVNANGGLGGRVVKATPGRIGPTIREERKDGAVFCQRVRAERPFAAILLGDDVIDPGAPPDLGVARCLRDAGIVTVEPAMTRPVDQVELEANAPLQWAPSAPEYGALVRAQLDTLSTDGFFEESRGVLVLVASTDVARRTRASVVGPFLRKLERGGTPARVVVVAEPAARSARGREALDRKLAAAAGRADRVLAVGGTGVMTEVLTSQSVRDYRPRWALASPDRPSLLTSSSGVLAPDVGERSTGLGVDVITDTVFDRGARFPDPDNPTQVLCTSIMNAARAPADRGDAAIDFALSLRTCDGIMFLKAVLDRSPAGEVTADRFAAAAHSLGADYRSAIAPGTAFTAGTYAGTSLARALRYERTCDCLRYSGKPIRLD